MIIVYNNIGNVSEKSIEAAQEHSLPRLQMATLPPLNKENINSCRFFSLTPFPRAVTRRPWCLTQQRCVIYARICSNAVLLKHPVYTLILPLRYTIKMSSLYPGQREFRILTATIFFSETATTAVVSLALIHSHAQWRKSFCLQWSQCWRLEFLTRPLVTNEVLRSCLFTRNIVFDMSTEIKFSTSSCLYLFIYVHNVAVVWLMLTSHGFCLLRHICLKSLNSSYIVS